MLNKMEQNEMGEKGWKGQGTIEIKRVTHRDRISENEQINII